ncbi:multicopper oxidase family protein [Glaciimonas sp. GG7]
MLPSLTEKAPAQPAKPGTLLKRNAQPATAAGCQPDGDISRDGHDLKLTLQVEVRPNEINNPSNPNGTKDKVSLRSYGGCLSGPLIEALPGDTLRVNLINDLSVDDPSCPNGTDPTDGSPGCFNTINLHVHGMHVSPAGNSDNVLLNIAPQTRFGYEINIPSDHPSGTFWYHAHRHGSTAVQVASGASGVLIVRGHRAYTGGASGDIDTILHDATGSPIKEQVFAFQQIPYACFDANNQIILTKDKTWYCPPNATGVVENFGLQLASATVWDTSGRFTSINGAVQPLIQNIKAGEILRWRFVHAGIHDTINLQIVPMVSKGDKGQLPLHGILSGSPKQQAPTIAEICPVKPVNLVPQFEIAADGLTRTAIRSIGLNKKSVSGGIGSNFLQPGYRSDVLVVFPHDGTYCVLNQAATPAERVNAKKQTGGGQGPNETQLLATVVVKDGKAVTGDVEKYIQQALYDGNEHDEGLPKAALDGLLRGDLTPWRGMPESGPASNSWHPVPVEFYIGTLPAPPATPNPNGAFGFYINAKAYNPDRIDFTRQLGATEDWLLTSAGEPHIFHIHVNPFEVMDVTHDGKSIFGPHGECLIKPDSLGLENQYCGMSHTFKDTVFVQNNYQVLIRTKYDRYIGEFVIHCHILDHEDSGMMANIQIVPDTSAPGGGIGMVGMQHAGHSDPGKH